MDAVATRLIVVVLVLALFLVIRSFWWWYWGIGRMVAALERIDATLAAAPWMRDARR